MTAKKNKGARSRTSTAPGGLSEKIRRLGAGFLTTTVLGLQALSCSFMPTPGPHVPPGAVRQPMAGMQTSTVTASAPLRLPVPTMPTMPSIPTIPTIPASIPGAITGAVSGALSGAVSGVITEAIPTTIPPAVSTAISAAAATATAAAAAAVIATATTPSAAIPGALPSLKPTAVTGKTMAFKACPQFFAGGVAPLVQAATQLRELCFDAFAVLHSGSTRTPVFVAERLNRASVTDAKGEERTDKFYADARLPRSERAELDDYRGSGYARGHMAPAGNMPTPQAMAQSFSLANMVPQNAKQNSGPWARIEKDTRSYAQRAKGDVYVITGPVFNASSPQIGGNHVRVPSHLFKLVYDAQSQRAWAHWQANAADAKAGPPISYEQLVQRIGMELLPGIRVQ